MANTYYEHDNPFIAGTLVASAGVNSQLDLIETGFEAVETTFSTRIQFPDSFSGNHKIPPQSLNNRLLYINSSGDADLYNLADIDTAVAAAAASATASAASATASQASAVNSYNLAILASAQQVEATAQATAATASATASATSATASATSATASAASATAAANSVSAATTNNVLKTTNQTIGGIKTFSAPIVGSFTTSAQTEADIVTAQTRANLGVTNAATAQTRADLGVSNAATAQTKANLGVTNAATAQARANLGVTNAAAAATLANTAVINAATAASAAATAQTRANLGVTNAATAQTRANLGVTNAATAASAAATAQTKANLADSNAGVAYTVAGAALPKAGGTLTGAVYMRNYVVAETSHRDKGIFGTYDSTKTQHIWSMGTAYRNAADGSSYGNLYGLAYKYQANGGNHAINVIINGVEKASFGNNIWSAGNITAYSDRRVKTDLEVIPNALDKVCQLSGYTFLRTDTETEDAEGNPVAEFRQTGVIAQEVLEVLPEAVMENEEGMYSVAYGNMVGLLIEAIKEQQVQIDELKASR
jgi:hypothetical protein